VRNTYSKIEHIMDQRYWDWSIHAEFSEGIYHLSETLSEESMLDALQIALDAVGTAEDPELHTAQIVMLYFLKICWNRKREFDAECKQFWS